MTSPVKRHYDTSRHLAAGFDDEKTFWFQLKGEVIHFDLTIIIILMHYFMHLRVQYRIIVTLEGNDCSDESVSTRERKY